MRERILVTGASGLVGSRFVELYPQPRDLLTPTRSEVDLTEEVSVCKHVLSTNPSTVVHFAAYTNVGKAQEQRDDRDGECWMTNVVGTRNLLYALDPKRTRFIFVSTDMVFSGSSEHPGPYSEDQRVDIGTDGRKLTWYGYTKAVAEELVTQRFGDEAVILRIIYPVRARFAGKLDYLRKPLKLYDQDKLYPLYKDQSISITFIDEACLAIRKIIEGEHKGVFHAGSKNTTTPHELISYFLKILRNADGLSKSSVDDSRYPKFGGLKVENTQEKLGIDFSTWREVVEQLIEQEIRY